MFGNMLNKIFRIKFTGLRFGFLVITLILLTACQSSALPSTGKYSGSSPVPSSTPVVNQPQVSSSSQAIKLINTSFDPQQVSIAAGTTVVCTNSDSMNHTVTADDKSFDSGNLKPGDTFKFTFTKPGTYPYYCQYHGGAKGIGMSGVITVTAK